MKENFAKTIKLTWNLQTLVHHFEISFVRAMGTQQEGNCPSYPHTQSGYTTPGDATEFTVSGLEEYSTYTITVRAVNRVGISGPTTVKVTTLKAGTVDTLSLKAAINAGFVTFLHTICLCSANWISSECQEHYSYLLRSHSPLG